MRANDNGDRTSFRAAQGGTERCRDGDAPFRVEPVLVGAEELAHVARSPLSPGNPVRLMGEHGLTWANMGVKGITRAREVAVVQSQRVSKRTIFLFRIATNLQLLRGFVPQGGRRGAKRAYRKGARRPVSRVLSGPCGRGRPFLWDATRDAPHATNPGDGAGTPLRHAGRIAPPAPPATPIRSCSRWGLPCRPRCRGRGALLPHRLHPCPQVPKDVRAVCFLWHCPWGRPRRPLAGTVFPWSPDFPPPQRGAATVQPSGGRVMRPPSGLVKLRRVGAAVPDVLWRAHERALP